VGGSPHVPDVRPILEATSTLVAATGILNVWVNDPGDTAAADASRPSRNARIVVDTDPVRAKAVARNYAQLYLGLRNYTQNLLDFGFTEGDLSNGGSDRLIDAVIPQGSADQIAEVVRAHVDAGADHVCVQPLGEEGIPRESWAAIAKVLLD
jgi:Flp pilus assembly protein CpaB